MLSCSISSSSVFSVSSEKPRSLKGMVSCLARGFLLAALGVPLEATYKLISFIKYCNNSYRYSFTFTTKLFYSYNTIQLPFFDFVPFSQCHFSQLLSPPSHSNHHHNQHQVQHQTFASSARRQPKI